MSQPKHNSEEEKVFDNFREYWHYTRHLTKLQTDLLFDSLSTHEQNRIKSSYTRGGWNDLAMRDILDDAVDQIKDNFNVDLLEARAKVFAGKSVYMSLEVWEHVVELFSEYESQHTQYIYGGIRHEVCENNDKVVLLLPAGTQKKKEE